MNRPWQVWLAFGLCLSVVLAAMGWMSLTVLRLDRNEQAARVQSQREENARLALWRMDSALAPVTAQESARPYFAYGSFYSAARPYGNMVYDNTGNLNDRNSNNPNLYNKQQDELLLPSPLLTQTASNALIHFQIDEKGAFTSPQVPTGNKLDMAASVCATNDLVNVSSQRLVALRGSVVREQLLAITPEPPAGPQQAVRANAGRMAQYINNDDAQAAVQSVQLEQEFEGQQRLQQAQSQGAKNRVEFQKRAQNVQRQEVANYEANAGAWSGGNNGSNIPIPVSMDVREGAMKAAWLNGNLVLARRVILNGKTYIQGCWMDWENIKKWLVDDIRDLLPEAELVPVTVENSDRTEYRLAALPVKLKPGQLPGECAVTWSPIQISLLIAWICVLLGAAAVAALLLGAVTLSERRGAFVSAVTHELRTPLTTFRMYTEMLQGGMIADEGKRHRYLNTLRVEAERLSHLVENVLAYAKLERGVKGKRVEPIALRDLISRTKQRLSDRAEQAGMQIVVEGSAADFDALAKTDPSAIEQILFNLVDNASKYAVCAEEKVIRISAERLDGRVALRVSDSGPGFSTQERKRLFRPFSKSASEAAHSAPGVGLGLALSRRLARDMGGDLKLDVNSKSGASFILTMPAASRQESQPGTAESSPSPAS